MIGRIAALVAVTACYWLLALIVLGGLLVGDCFDAPACVAAKRRILQIGPAASVSIYLAIMALLGWRLFRRRD